MSTKFTNIEELNLFETQKTFDSYLKLSEQQLEKRYNTSAWRYINKSEMRAVYELLDLKKGSPMLEVGCGTGRLILPLKDEMEIYGLDFSPSFLNKIRQHTNRIHLVEGNAESLPFEDNFFNTVLCVRVIQHLSPKQQRIVIKEMVRVLKPGGSAIMLNYNSWSLLTIYKLICMKLGKFWPHWPLKKWSWIIDDYNSFFELKRYFEEAGLRVTHLKGAVMGEPDILRSVKISDFLDKSLPLLINMYYSVCDKLDLAFRNSIPFKYFMGRIVIRGVKQ